jgi:hypothetical protein
MVRQEIYGYLIAHYAVAALICQAATETGIDPDRVKFISTVRILADPGAFPLTANTSSGTELTAQLTPTRNLNPRRHRSYPRVIKRARHNSYRVKRHGNNGIRHTGPAAIHLVNHTCIDPTPETETEKP